MGTSYATEAEADAYFAERLNTSVWDGADSADKVKALKQATKAIDNLNFKGEKTSSTQEHEFPRYDDSEVPDKIKWANAEEAMMLLDGKDPEMEWENLDMVSQMYANIRSTYNRGSVPKNIVAGIMSQTAWRYLAPYLRDGRELTISRVG